jgi:hypothetical protein
MIKIEIFCKNCNNFIGSHELFSIYQQGLVNCHLIVKNEKKNNVLTSLKVVPQPERKKIKFAPSILVCIRCEAKLGSDSVIGPKDELAYCLSSEKIYFIEQPGSRRHNFDPKSKIKDIKDQFVHLIEFRDVNSFFGPAETSKMNNNTPKRTNFIETKFPSEQEISTFNIGDYVQDSPRTYQVELYVSAVFGNTIVYMPTGAGKTMVAAMLAACFNRFNPKKKVFFVCDRVPLVFQQASYLRYQTGLSVGEFCGEMHDKADSQLNADLMVFTCDFLINLLLAKRLYLEDCSCLIFDEIHHAMPGHSFTKLLENYYYKMEKRELRPRILGCRSFRFEYFNNFYTIYCLIGLFNRLS